MDTKSSGWMFTDAVNFVVCPKCGAQLSQYCLAPSGKKAGAVHMERLYELQKHPMYDPENYRAKSMSGSELFKRIKEGSNG